MSTFHTTTFGDASNPATWAEHAVPGPADHWIINRAVALDSSLAVAELQSGGTIELQAVTLTVNADVTFTVRSGAALTVDQGPCTLNLLGVLLFDGGVFTNLGQFESTNNSNAGLAAWGGALLVNPTNFAFGRGMPQTMDDGSGGPTTVRLQYTSWGPPASATYFPPAEILATVAHGATIDFATRDAAGTTNDPDFLPNVPVVQTGAITDTIVTFRRNGLGSYTATFPTPSADQSYYVPVAWTIGGNAFVQEFRVVVQNPDLPGKVLGGGSSAIVGPGVVTANPASQINVNTENTTIRS